MGPGRWLGAFLAVFVIMFVAPFPVYGLLSAIGAVEMPEGESPQRFVLAVLVMKTGTALGFVLLFGLARDRLRPRWLLYAAVWWIMFAVVETGQAIGPGYSTMEAVGGIIAEAIYFPLSALVVARVTRPAG